MWKTAFRKLLEASNKQQKTITLAINVVVDNFF